MLNSDTNKNTLQNDIGETYHKIKEHINNITSETSLNIIESMVENLKVFNICMLLIF